MLRILNWSNPYQLLYHAKILIVKISSVNNHLIHILLVKNSIRYFLTFINQTHLFSNLRFYYKLFNEFYLLPSLPRRLKQ